MAQTPEGKVKAEIKKLLARMGFIQAGSKKANWPGEVYGWYYMPVSNGMGVHGIPDFVCCYHGRFLGIEAKKPGGEPTANQLNRHEEIKTAMGEVLVVDDVSVLEAHLRVS
jgi:hypothetical protein